MTFRYVEFMTNTARIVTALLDGMVRTPGASAQKAPQYDAESLSPADKAVVDYLLARSWREPGPPGRSELADRFMAVWTGTEADGAVTTVSRVWPAWQLDNLAHAWASVRSTLMSFKWDADDQQDPGALAFRQVNRPAYGTIEVDYRVEQTACMRETTAVRLGGAGLIVKAQWDGPYGPSLEVVCHEKSRPAAERLIGEFLAHVESRNIYRGRHLTVQSGRIKFTRVEPAAFEDVIVPSGVLARVRDATVGLVDRRDQLARYGMGCGHAVVMAGPPGTGKTMMARAIATAMGSRVTTWLVTAKAFYSASSVTDFYDMVRAFGPALVIFEDLDLVGQARQYGPGGNNEILGELLNQMSGTQDNRDILTVASTNRFDVLDEALTDRPERVGAKIEIPVPGPDERRRLFDVMAKRYRTSIKMQAAGWHGVIRATDGFTGDWIRATVAQAVRQACGRVQADAMDLVLTEQDVQAAVHDMLRDRASVRRKP